MAAELRPLLGEYTFQRPALLQQALTHVSVLGAPSYQRLELLGDAVLDVLVSLHLLLEGSRWAPASFPMTAWQLLSACLLCNHGALMTVTQQHPKISATS